MDSFKQQSEQNIAFGTIDSILHKIQNNGLKFNTGKIKKAYEFSKKAHHGQKRRSGEDYITHPLQVAEILLDLGMDQDCIITALLHDVVEDTPVSLSDIEKHFGSKISFLLDGVTKISRIKFRNIYQKQSENIRKMILAMGRDVRVILVKLADRLHNLRTLEYLSTERQVAIAKETLEVYTPLASRLGMNEIKTEMEDLSFKYSQPENFRFLEEKMRTFNKDKNIYVKNVIDLIKKNLKDNKIWNYEVKGRYKNLYSIHNKTSYQNVSFEELHDIIAFRICLEEIHECYEALGVIHALWKPVPKRFKDFIAMPKRNKYQSLHTTVLGPEARQIEIQIRTYDMHSVAERGVASHWIYKMKNQGNQKNDLYKLNWLQDLVDWHKHSDSSEEFLDNVKRDLFESEIYIFTPGGEIKELPKDSVPVDCAYAIHTQLGERTIGARVNGQQVTLNHKLQSGDTVEIITSKTPKPSKDWLKICVTSKARSKIKNFFKAEERKKSIELGTKIFEKACHRYKISEKDLLVDPLFKEFMKSKGYNKKENLLLDLGFGKIDFKQILFFLRKNQNKVNSQIMDKIDITQSQNESDTSSSPLIIGGNEDVMVHFSKCCYPVAGDYIKAYVSRKKGIVIHRSICGCLDQISSDRFIEVDWKHDHSNNNDYVIALNIVCLDKPGTLSKLSEAFNFLGLNINNLKVNKTKSLKFVLVFNTQVKGLRQLEQLITKISQIENVLSVKRKMDFE
ncbi:MAG: bifunctional (p)ppGpp synthetase/guanosine-3',5'-bis(diphosphate) 3'-pyrophosphohydrolase [Bdellovibrionales bacterium]|nr:bifunctional (p)ppGpp synthetase/guanosine-3',5'-bis(diphosphate) 3'-pyrophosphohydrolase [Bdellovibrionales bacterium]